MCLWHARHQRGELGVSCDASGDAYDTAYGVRITLVRAHLPPTSASESAN